MHSAVVRCPSCEQPSRVPADALGLIVACPRCGWEFLALDGSPAPAPPPPPPVARRESIPVVYGSGRRPARPAPPPPRPDDDPPTFHPRTPAGVGVPVAVALLPLGVPLLWLALLLAVGPSEFSFMAGVAIALGTTLLGLGVATIRRWSVRLRVGVVAGLVVLGYASAAVFYFARPEWLERVREVAAVWPFGGANWREYRPDDRSFKLIVPGEPKDVPSPLPGWELTAKQFTDDKNPTDVYVAAAGPPPDLGAKAGEEAWFGKVREAVTAASGGSVADERKAAVGRAPAKAEAREYLIDLPDGRRRVVQVVWTPQKVYYLAVDGLYLSGERHDVRLFLGSFAVTR